MTATRRWIYWTTTWVSGGLILAPQILFLSQFRVDSALKAVLFGLATNSAYLLAVFLNNVFGFIRGPKITIHDTSWRPPPSSL
jgi:hypothetical protein